MKLLLTGHYDVFFRDELCFKSKNGLLHENNFVKFITLKNEFNKFGIQLIASDQIKNFANFDGLIVHDHPKDKLKINAINSFRGPKYLTTEEAPFILPESFSIDRLNDYRLIFSNFPGSFSHQRIIPSLPHHIDTSIALEVRKNDIPLNLKSKIVYVGTNKKPHEKLLEGSNYKFRDELLDWYIKNDPDSLDLFGSNWTRKFFNGNDLLTNLFNYSKFDNLFTNTDRKFKKIYMGKITSKYYLLNKYKFQFCLESAVGFDGYVTEKIFDGLICRNVPVYYPSTPTSLRNILPDNIYINISDFRNLNDLNSYLKSMSINTFTDYINRIDNFIDNLPVHLHNNYWAQNVVKIIAADLCNFNNSD